MAQAFETYKGLTRLSETATEEAGEKISDNFSEIADRVGPYYSGTGTPDADDDQAGSGGNGTFYVFSWWVKTDTDQVWVCVDSAPNAAVWVEVAEASTFLGMTDTPSSYSGQSLKLVRVNSGESALEFVAAGGATDEKVAVDSLATAGYLGVAAGDGVLRTDGTLAWTDGGNYVTLAVAGLQSVTSDLTTPSVGAIWWRSDLSELRVLSGSRCYTPAMADAYGSTASAGIVAVKFGVKTVPASASSVTITFSTDDLVGGWPFLAGSTVILICVPNWATSWRITSISTSQAVVEFGTAVGSAGGTLYWLAIGRKV